MYRKDKKHEYYTIKARKEGYPARSVYKLKDIDEKFHFFKKEDVVLDLGASPGSWILYISEKIGDKGRVFGVDIQDIKINLPQNAVFVKKSILEIENDGFLNKKYNSVVADLSPNTTGIKSIDAGVSLELSEKAFEIAKKVLAKNGSFVCKIFQGEGMDDFLKEISSHFKIFKRYKPKAVIKNSKEFYIVAKGFLGQEQKREKRDKEEK